MKLSPHISADLNDDDHKDVVCVGQNGAVETKLVIFDDGEYLPIGVEDSMKDDLYQFCAKDNSMVSEKHYKPFHSDTRSSGSDWKRVQ